MSQKEIELKFLGGAEEVGRLGMLYKQGKTRFLFDYGISPTDPPKYPQASPNVDAVFLSHAHLDHSGLMPQHAGYYQNLIYTTPPTMEMANLLVKDSLKIAEYEGYLKRFDQEDIMLMDQAFMPLDYGGEVEPGSGRVTVSPVSAGHIPGSSMFRIMDGERTTVFSGDINTIDTQLVKKALPPACDNLVLESTYSGREHPPREDIQKEFLAAVEEVISRGGRVIVPAFAVGRGQEVLMLLKKSGHEIWLDGMGIKVARIFKEHGGYLADSDSFKRAFKKARVVRNPFDRRKAVNGDVIITTSGMLDGGPVLYYLNQFMKDENSGLFLTGYQVKDTNGRRLLDTGKILVNGVEMEPKLDMRFFDFSAHAGHSELKDFVMKSAPENLVLMHGDNREILGKELEAEGFKVHYPMTGEALKL